MKLFNTLTNQKEEFIPLEPGKVKMYACGPTVYNYFHIGNARPFIVFDTLRRYFEYRGYDVTFVQNFTDVDDKMINRAHEEGITVKELGEKYIAEYLKDAQGLNIKPATYHPKATETIDDIIKLVQTLIDKGFAYNKNGDVYFRTKKFKEYGKLSHQPLDDLEAGARIDVNEDKEDPMDFALWKKQKEDYEIAWESPWGMGRPGWHIECSAMAGKYLGETIDIHGGGKDLIFPHHENEIAQSECATGKPFARYWMHNGYININNQKMSKSKGNFFTVRDIVQNFDYEVIRYFLLSAHYRSPINFSFELMEQAKSSLDRIYTCIDNLKFILQQDNADIDESGLIESVDQLEQKFIEAMDDDLNTADAISVLFEMVREINTSMTPDRLHSHSVAQYALDKLVELGGVLGLLYRKEETIDAEIERLIEQRQQARKSKDFALADKIRDDLKAQGITLFDTPTGVKWTKEKN